MNPGVRSGARDLIRVPDTRSSGGSGGIHGAVRLTVGRAPSSITRATRNTALQAGLFDFVGGCPYKVPGNRQIDFEE